ncbi:MAG TPA: PEP/pyruvate-binding domain-containing protein [Chloroflexota bacterium]|nr:PEP/pyruvate-binding domain-containing protein [Chloroflexota bacterium]
MPRPATARAKPRSTSQSCIQWLDSPGDQSQLGGKAAPLARALAAGLPVPPGFVVTPNAFHDDSSRAADPLQLEAVDQIIRAYRDLAARTGESQPRVVVRSSAAAEDLAGASFAGQYDTFLHVCGEAPLLTYIARCWASLWSENAASYRRHYETRTGAALPPPRMAVLVQKLVDADAAGVAFTAHPTTGDSTRVLINSGWGLGQSIVDGEVEADTWVLDRETLAVVEQHVGLKASRTGAGPDAPREPLPDHLHRAPSLTSEHAAAVAALALRAEAVTSGPADVEWAIAGGTVWLLQARPITTIAAAAPTAAPSVAPLIPSPDAAPRVVGPSATFPFEWPTPEAPQRQWQLRSVDQRRAEVIRPLERDVRLIWAGTFERAAVICGRPRYRVVLHVNGYEYQAEVANPRPESDQALRRDAMEQVGAGLAERGETYRRVVAFPAIDAGNARLAAVAPDSLSSTDLATHFEQTLAWYERLWTEHWTQPQDNPVLRFTRFYREHLPAPTSDEDLDNEIRALLTYEPNLLTDAIDGLIDLARLVQREPALRALFLSATAQHALDSLPTTPSGTAFLAQLDVLLETQGLRSGAGFGTERSQILPGWREQPSLVVELVQKYVPQDLDALLAARRAAVAERDRRAAELRSLLPDDATRSRFDFWLAAARAHQVVFEDHNLKIDSASSALLHRSISAVARRLAATGILASPDDVWWLHTHELSLALRSTDSPPDSTSLSHWSALLAARRAHHAWCQQLTPPPAIGDLSSPPPPEAGFGPMGRPARSAETTPRPPEPTPSNLLVKGSPGSKGVATGIVRLVPHDDLVPNVAEGDVLVARNAGPLWTPVFPTVAAVVLDQGVLFQHAMLTCREYGVPAVFQTRDATQRLREGQRVTVDGEKGWVLDAR